MAARNRSNFDYTQSISKSFFVTNFPDNTIARDLWEVCNGYGTVVDVFIPNRKSKSGKRFAFVRFFKVENVDRLVANLCTLWIGRMHLYANVVRYDRPPLNSPRPNAAPRLSAKSVPRPAANGASSYVSALKGNPNTINHTSLAPAQVLDEECLVERDLENFVLGEVKDFSSINNLYSLRSKEGFQHIGSRWGEMLELEENEDDNFARKRICIRTKQEDNILEKFKIIVRGKIFVVRAKELFVWSPSFKGVKDGEFFSDDDSVYGEEENNIDLSKKENLADEDESDIKGVSETVFGEEDNPLDQEPIQNLSPNVKENSSNPFNLINLINKQDKGEANSELESSLRFPLGFTHADQGTPGLGSKAKKEWIKELSNKHKVDFLSIQETKTDHISDMDIKSLWVKILMIAIYAPQSSTSKRLLWNFLSSLIGRWDGQFMVMGYFNENIRIWVNDYRKMQYGHLEDLRSKPRDIDTVLDQGGANDDILQRRVEIVKKLHDINSANARDNMQKAKIKWAIEGDKNSKFFHGIINRKRANLAIKGVMEDGEWVDDPYRVKEEFRLHFANRFRTPGVTRYKLNYTFPNKLSLDQLGILESMVSKDEVRDAVWGYGENKSPGPDGFSFEFFRKFWDIVCSDLFEAVKWFFDYSSFPRGCNSSFIALILKNQDPKFVNDYRSISLIGSLYKAYDSIRRDFLEDVLIAFGFGPKWYSWISGYLSSSMASVLLNVMESLHLSVSKDIEAGIFKGIKIDSSLNLSHLFYADDAVFIGEWSSFNFSGIPNILLCFSLLSGLSINLNKSNLIGVGVRPEVVKVVADSLGCLSMKAPFKYLGVMVGGNCSFFQAWEDVIEKIKARLLNWKLKTLSVGGRC
nr:RNA-directed DNA polymerase, eukaryota [Tanacetum cinerariifolium]